MARRRDETLARLGPFLGGSPNRHQDRRGNGRWIRNGSLGCQVCQNDECRAILMPRPASEGGGYPDVCHLCGAPQIWETCLHGYQRFPDPANPFTECGARAVAVDIETKTGRCEQHVDRTVRPVLMRLGEAVRSLPKGVPFVFRDGKPAGTMEDIITDSPDLDSSVVLVDRRKREDGRIELVASTGAVLLIEAEAAKGKGDEPPEAR